MHQIVGEVVGEVVGEIVGEVVDKVVGGVDVGGVSKMWNKDKEDYGQILRILQQNDYLNLMKLEDRL